MNFVHGEYLYIVILVFIGLLLALSFFERRFWKWVRRNWFKNPTLSNKISLLFYFLFIGLMLLSLLDLRGKEERVSSSIPDQKTIVLIDNSASMLAEDIRPSRFERAVVIARHFVKKAIGHQISIVVFSDTQKQIVPFTDDVDLLDSRLAALENKDISGGGSNISKALLESMQYFREANNDKKMRGNILLFTDSEEHGPSLDIDVPKSVSVATIGVGTRRGAPIPQRGRNNSFRGYKRHNGEKVITKLNEDFLKKLEDKIENYKYWVVTSYTMPTEDVLNFFKKIYKKRLSEGTARVRPVKMEYLVIPGIISFCLFVLLSRFRRFKKTLALAVILFVSISPNRSHAQEAKPNEEKIQLPQKKLQQLREGKLNRSQRLKLAEELAKKGGHDQAQTLYRENLRNKKKDDRAKFNYGVSLLESGDISEGIQTLSELQDSKMLSKKEKDLINSNIIKALKLEKQKQKQNNKNKKGKDKKKSQKNSGDNSSQGKGQQKNKDQQKKDKSGKKKKENQEQNKGKSGESEKENQQQKKLTNEPRTLEEKEEEIRKKRRMKKTPALIKQIMDDDRKLQKRYIDTSTEKGRSNKKDW